MFVPVVAGSDKMTVSVATSHQEYHPVYMSPGNLSNLARRVHGNALLPVAFLPIPKSTCLFFDLTLITNLPAWICSNKEASEKCQVPSILPADISCLPGTSLSITQSRYDNPGGCKMSRRPFSSCCLWSRTIYCRLSGAGVACCYRPRLVSEVSRSIYLQSCVLLVGDSM